MAANVLYFGPDEWNRVTVLQSAGYSVRECPKLEDLDSALRVTPKPDAVVVNGFGRAYARPAVKIVHARVALAPVIIFPSQDEPEFEKSGDLVVETLARPEEWLVQMAALIERSRGLRKNTISLKKRSLTLIQQSVEAQSKLAASRTSSANNRERSAQQRERSGGLRSADPRKPRREE